MSDHIAGNGEVRYERVTEFFTGLRVVMSVSSNFLQFVLEQLAGLAGVVPRRMFGGVGLYQEGAFFGLVADDTLYLRVDDSNRGDYTARAAAPFRPYADRPHLSMSYFEAPAEVLESAAELAVWARRSIAVAQRAPPARERKLRAHKKRRADTRRARAARAKR